MKFAKLFELENNEQVLITIDFESDDYDVIMTTDFEKATARATITCKTEEEQQKLFENIQIEQAVKFRKQMKQHF